ncbi:MAG: HAD-IA family hydrolase [Phenylobacterium sp.]|nr:HAD-IA family hydrolase [Phenylobacterium sp.]MBP8245609.1 HAD-IA family hydrolase [Phenylobacterium sp.]
MGARKLSGVIFDADGVLQHAGPFGTQDWVWSAQQHRDFVTGFYRAAAPDTLADVDAFIAACERALAQAGWPREAATYLARWTQDAVIPDPAMLEDVRRLRAAGVACYLGSNQDAFWAAHIETTLGYGQLLDDLFISCRLGAAKPQAAFFEAMLAQVPFPREELIFFDDKAANVEAALACGLEARLFTDRARYLRDLEDLYGLEA